MGRNFFLGNKNNWGKTILGAQIGPKICLSCFPGGNTTKSCAQPKFEAKRLKIALFRTDRTFWDPKLPHSHRPILGQKLEICTLQNSRQHYAAQA